MTQGTGGGPARLYGGPLYTGEEFGQARTSVSRLVLGMALFIFGFVFMMGPFKASFGAFAYTFVACIWFGFFLFISAFRVKSDYVENNELPHIQTAPKYNARIFLGTRIVVATLVTLVLYIALVGGLVLI